MNSNHAPMASSDAPIPAPRHINTRFTPVIEPIIGKWPLHLDKLRAASPGIALIARSDNVWLVSRCGADVDPAELEGRVERYMISRFVLITSTPELTVAEAEAAHRIAHLTLSGPAAMPIIGPCPVGAGVGYHEYLALRDLIGKALRSVHSHGILSTESSPTLLRSGAIGKPDPAAETALATYNAVAATPRVLTGKLRVRAVEVAGGYLLLPGSCVDMAANEDPGRCSGVLEDIHSGVLLYLRRDGICRLQHPMIFASLEAMAIYCLGHRKAVTERWTWLSEE